MKKHSNHLIHETSPYLLQHAHNPVDWFPWGEKALSLAKKEDKPILFQGLGIDPLRRLARELVPEAEAA